jgi:disulfide oxidoreductase YuzD
MDQYPEYKEIWLDFEENWQKKTLKQKYSIWSSRVFLSLPISKQKTFIMQKNKFASFDYVMLPLRDVADSLVEPTDAELKKIYKIHKEKYKTEESGHSIMSILTSIRPKKTR